LRLSGSWSKHPGKPKCLIASKATIATAFERFILLTLSVVGILKVLIKFSASIFLSMPVDSLPKRI